jgi:Amt family ammonium transporter
MTTAVSAAIAMVVWMLLDVIKQGKPTLIGACTGVLAGLVGITPAAGFVPLWAALIIGATTSPICYMAISLIKQKFRIDDALDAFGCHGVGGIWGGILTGVFCNPDIGGLGGPGLIYGSWGQFGAQVAGIAITIVLVSVGALVCAGLTRIFTPLRVGKKEELVGLDLSEHAERAYPSFNGLD